MDLCKNVLLTTPAKDGKPEKTTVSPIANPWLTTDTRNTLNTIAPGTVEFTRTLAVAWCSHSTVIQCRDWLPDAVGGVCWYALDNPGESPRFPIFAGATTLPDMLQVCGQHSERDDAALWHYRKANRLATVRWGTYRKMIEPARDYFISKGLRELPWIEQAYATMTETDPKGAQQMLNGYVADFFAATIAKWDEMTRKMWRQTWAGF